MKELSVHSNKITRSFSGIHYQEKELELHARSSGSESENENVIILLHPSPLSSTFMIPLLTAFSQSHHAIAWDAPGYGDSSKLAIPSKSLTPYIDCLALFMESKGIEQAIIYGNATGAQIAIEFSKKYPDKTKQLVLENVTLFDDQETAGFMASYFPDLSPKDNGQHVHDTWEIVNNLFKYFPWYEQTQAAKLNVPSPPASILQATFIDYLKAGDSYADAYIAAIHNERPEKLKAVAAKTDIVLWQDSIIYKYCCRLKAVELPDNIVLHQVDSGMDKRLATLKAIID